MKEWSLVKKTNVVWISNVVFVTYLQSVVNVAVPTYKHMTFSCVAYDGLWDDPDKVAEADFVVVSLNFESLYPQIANDIAAGKLKEKEIIRSVLSMCQTLYVFIREYTDAPIIWFGFEDYYYYKYDSVYGTIFAFDGVVDEINRNLVQQISDIAYIDLKRLIAKIGIKHAYNDRDKYRWNAPYSKELIFQMVAEFQKQYLIMQGRTKKCLVLDCDNVLWGGILSEDGVEGIKISESGQGRFYHEFQVFLLSLYYHGIILTVCSKNDKECVTRVFEEHKGMVLRTEHIAYFAANWDNKVKNIISIAQKLNISLSSMIFIDDSIMEIDMVRKFLPEVVCVHFEKRSGYGAIADLNLKSKINLETVILRNKTYQTDVVRAEIRENSLSVDEYLRELKTKVFIHPVAFTELSRISELTQRTNKCTNGIRYSIEQLKRKLSAPDYSLYSVYVSDKLSDLGLVGTIGIDNHVVDVFSLSCRALGRNIENEMITFLQSCSVQGYRFVSTEQNLMVDIQLGTYFTKYGQ